MGRKLLGFIPVSYLYLINMLYAMLVCSVTRTCNSPHG